MCVYIATLSVKHNDRIDTGTEKKNFYIKKGCLDARDALEQPKNRNSRYYSFANLLMRLSVMPLRIGTFRKKDGILNFTSITGMFSSPLPS